MSVGGNVTISARGNITNLAVSLPTTWYLSNNNTTVNTAGGGNLTVTAGGNILSGDYFVAEGTATLTAGGLIGSSGLNTAGGASVGEVSTLLAAQDGIFNVSARQGVDIGAMVDPSYIQGTTLLNGYSMHADSQSYSANSALNVISTTGDVSLNTLASPSLIDAGEPSKNDDSFVLPATVEMTALSGGIDVERYGELYPSATGELSLIAGQSINLFNDEANTSISGKFFGLIDASASVLPSPLNPIPATLNGVTNEFDGVLTSDSPVDHSQVALHGDDTQPVRVFSLTGSITNGTLGSNAISRICCRFRSTSRPRSRRGRTSSISRSWGRICATTMSLALSPAATSPTVRILASPLTLSPQLWRSADRAPCWFRPAAISGH